jgi:hypothetical protein
LRTATTSSVSEPFQWREVHIYMIVILLDILLELSQHLHHAATEMVTN